VNEKEHVLVGTVLDHSNSPLQSWEVRDEDVKLD
jgi:hypothetical protein